MPVAVAVSVGRTRLVRSLGDADMGRELELLDAVRMQDVAFLQKIIQKNRHSSKSSKYIIDY